MSVLFSYLLIDDYFGESISTLLQFGTINISLKKKSTCLKLTKFNHNRLLPKVT